MEHFEVESSVTAKAGSAKEIPESDTSELTVIKESEDLEAIAGISATYEGHVFSYSHEDIERYGQRLQEPHAFLATVGGTSAGVAGFIAASESIFPGSLFINELLVDDRMRGRGYATELVGKAIEFAKTEGMQGVYVETEDWNLPAQALYEKCGFLRVDNPDWRDGVTYRMEFGEGDE